MKAKNNNEVYKAVVSFSRYLIFLIFLAVCIFSAFMKTSSVEVYKILAKTQEYDNIQMKQMNLTERMDTIYFYTSLLNSDPKINNVLMQNSLSNRKIQVLEEVNTMSEKDCRMYKKLANEMNTFLGIKDSIRLATLEEELARTDLLRCISDNKRITRTISAGGLTFER